MKADDLARLAAPFRPEDIDWKPGSVTRDKSKGLAMAYLTSRAVQERLDAVCGPADWRNEFREGPGGGVLCGLSIYVERTPHGPGEWITKWDGANNTAVESTKGGLSSAIKRAAVQWGIGRYLYDLPAQWVRLDERGRFAEAPRVPREFMPAAESRPSSPATSGLTSRPERDDYPGEALHAGPRTDAEPAASPPLDTSPAGVSAAGPSPAQAADPSGIEAVEQHATAIGLKSYGLAEVLRTYGVVRLSELSSKQLAACLTIDADGAQAFNADGFIATVRRKLAAAPPAKRQEVHEAAVEAAGEQFGGALLGRIHRALDQAVGRAGAEAYAGGQAPSPALSPR